MILIKNYTRVLTKYWKDLGILAAIYLKEDRERF